MKLNIAVVRTEEHFIVEIVCDICQLVCREEIYALPGVHVPLHLPVYLWHLCWPSGDHVLGVAVQIPMHPQRYAMASSRSGNNSFIIIK